MQYHSVEFLYSSNMGGELVSRYGDAIGKYVSVMNHGSLRRLTVTPDDDASA